MDHSKPSAQRGDLQEYVAWLRQVSTILRDRYYLNLSDTAAWYSFEAPFQDDLSPDEAAKECVAMKSAQPASKCWWLAA
jgi:hypothetical protein